MSVTQKPSHISLHWIWFIVLIVALDQGTKYLVVGSLEANRPIGILPLVDFVLSYNKGISFSWFQFGGDVQRWSACPFWPLVFWVGGSVACRLAGRSWPWGLP